MMRLPVVVRPSADTEIDDAWIYLLEHANADVAERFLSSAQATFEAIGNSPRGYSEYVHRNPSAAGFRMRPMVQPYQEWLVFYEIVGGVVEIAHIHHGARDLGTQSFR